MEPIHEGSGAVLLEIRLSPRASREGLGGIHDGRLKISVTAPPVDNEANDELLRFLAKRLGVPRSTLSIVRGASSRNKTIRVESLDLPSVVERLS